MSKFRLLVAISAATVLAGCAYAPPSEEDNPYYTTKPLKPSKVPSAGNDRPAKPSEPKVRPIRPPSDVRATPLPLAPIVPGKTLPAPVVYEVPTYGLPIGDLDRVDMNNDGVVTADELLSYNLGKIMSFDKNNDGYLSEAEFIAALGDRRNRNGQASQMFRNADTNRDGRLSSQEVADYLRPSIAALDPERKGVINSLKPFPEPPKPAHPPSASTIGAGLPRLVSAGAEGPRAPVAHKASAAPSKNARRPAVSRVAPSRGKAAPAKKATVKKAAASPSRGKAAPAKRAAPAKKASPPSKAKKR